MEKLQMSQENYYLIKLEEPQIAKAMVYTQALKT